MRPWRTPLLLAAPGLVLAAGAVAVALEGPDSHRLFNAALAGIGVLMFWSVAAAVRLRYPQRPLGLLLFALAAALPLQSLVASPDALLFTGGRLVRPAVEWLLVWVMLAFPTGRLPGWRERALVLAGALSVLLLWLPSLMFSPRIPIAGPFVRCLGECPRNLLFVADQPLLAHALQLAFRGVGVLILLGTAAVLASRLRQATPLMRRALAPVLVACIARVLAIAGLLVSNGLVLPLVITLWAVPLAIALGLVRGRLYMARALQQLVTGLRARPDMGSLREVMAQALDDPTLEVAYWLKDRDRWVDARGQVLLLAYPTVDHGRAVTVVRDGAGLPVAALVHDRALLEEPALIEAVASSMQSALESHRVEAELAASRATTAHAVEEERHRIERDLHDGAQQRLIALRMKLSVTARLMEHDPRRAASLVGEMGLDVEAAIAELRALAHGVVPPLLVERGLRDALADVARRAPMVVHTELGDVGRCAPAVEVAVYFCCVEALQNAAKHAGEGATASLTLELNGDVLRFRVEDDGVGAKAALNVLGGQGLLNMRQRVEPLGGRVTFDAQMSRGFVVMGQVPAEPPMRAA